jgi:hypothetical protein
MKFTIGNSPACASVLRRAMPESFDSAVEKRFFNARTDAQRTEVVQTVLGHLFPGQDVKVRARNKQFRLLLTGYWIWSISELRHLYVPRSQVFNQGSGRDPKTYRKVVVHRIMRWTDFTKVYEKITGVAVTT